MPYKHRNPVTEEEFLGPVDEWEMKRQRWTGHHTLCQTLREIYVMTKDQEIRTKLRLAMAYSKAMNNKLQWYKHQEEAANVNDGS